MSPPLMPTTTVTKPYTFSNTNKQTSGLHVHVHALVNSRKHMKKKKRVDTFQTTLRYIKGNIFREFLIDAGRIITNSIGQSSRSVFIPKKYNSF